jgi:hypothetical protein
MRKDKLLECKSVELDDSIKHKIADVYRRKINGEVMAYGLMLVLCDALCICVISRSLPVIQSWTKTTYWLLSVWLLASIFITAVYAYYYMVIPRKLHRLHYICVKDIITKKEAVKDLDLDKNGFNKYIIYKNKDEFKCLCKDDYNRLHENSECYFIYITRKHFRNKYKPLLALDTDLGSLQAEWERLNKDPSIEDRSFLEKKRYLSKIGKAEIKSEKQRKKKKRHSKIKNIIKILKE